MKLKKIFLNKRMIVSIIITILLALWIFNSLLPGHFIIKVLFIGLSFLIVNIFIWYIFDEKMYKEELKYQLAITVIIIITFLPFIIKGYFYYDDYWSFIGEPAPWINNGLVSMRVFQGLLIEAFCFVLPSNAYIIRMFIILFLIMYSAILFKWINKYMGNIKLAFLYTILLTCSSVVADAIGYSTTVSFMPGVLAASLSVILFDKLYFGDALKILDKIVLSFLIISCLVFSFMFYQIASPIVFLMLSIFIYFNKDKKNVFKYNIIYLLYFTFSTIFYFISNKILCIHYNVEVVSRGNIVNNIVDIVEKAKWFILTVIPATIDRIIAALFGKILFLEKNYWYFINYTKENIRIIFILIVLLLLSTVIYNLIRNKNKIINIMLLVAMIPLSYYPFLLLEENGYLTYYAFSLVSIIAFFSILGSTYILNGILKFSKSKLDIQFVDKWYLVGIGIVLIIQCNVYVSSFWVDENRETYNYLKNTISVELKNRNHIHVFGVLNPGQGNVYSRFATIIALKELKLNPDNYIITVSDDENFISIIQKKQLEENENKISLEEKELLLSYYIKDETYNRYLIKDTNLSEDEFEKIKNILIKLNFLPESYEDIVTVDMRWIKAVH